MSYRYIPGDRDYFRPPHGGRPPSDEAVREATRRYCYAELASIKSRDEYADFNRRMVERYGTNWKSFPPATTPAAAEPGRERAVSRR